MKFNKKIVKSTILLLTTASVLPLFYKTCSTTAMEALTVQPVHQNSINIDAQDKENKIDEKFNYIIEKHQLELFFDVTEYDKKDKKKHEWLLDPKKGSEISLAASNLGSQINGLISKIKKLKKPGTNTIDGYYLKTIIKLLESHIYNKYDKQNSSNTPYVKFASINKLITYVQNLKTKLEQAIIEGKVGNLIEIEKTSNDNAIDITTFAKELKDICFELLRTFEVFQEKVIDDLAAKFIDSFKNNFSISEEILNDIKKEIKTTFENYGINNVELVPDTFKALLKKLLSILEEQPNSFNDVKSTPKKISENKKPSHFDSIISNIKNTMSNNVKKPNQLLAKDAYNAHREKFFKDKTDPLNLTDEKFRKPIITSTIELLKLIEDFNQKDMNQKATNLKIEQRLPNFEAIVESLNNLIGKEKTKVNVKYLEDCLNLLPNWLQVVEKIQAEKFVDEKEQQTTKNSIQQEKEIENYSNNIKLLLPKIKSLYDNLKKLKNDLINDIIETTCKYYFNSMDKKYGKYSDMREYASLAKDNFGNNIASKVSAIRSEFENSISNNIKSYVLDFGVFQLEWDLELNLQQIFEALEIREREITLGNEFYNATTDFVELSKQHGTKLFFNMEDRPTKTVLTIQNCLENILTRFIDFLKNRKDNLTNKRPYKNKNVDFDENFKSIDKLLEFPKLLLAEYKEAIGKTNAPVGIFALKNYFLLGNVFNALKDDKSLPRQKVIDDAINKDKTIKSYGLGLTTNKKRCISTSDLSSGNWFWTDDKNLGYAYEHLHEFRTIFVKTLCDQIYIALFKIYEQQNEEIADLLKNVYFEKKLKAQICDYLTKNFQQFSEKQLLIDDLHTQCATLPGYYDTLPNVFTDLFKSLDDEIRKNAKFYGEKNSKNFKSTVKQKPLDLDSIIIEFKKEDQYMKDNNLEHFAPTTHSKEQKEWLNRFGDDIIK